MDLAKLDFKNIYVFYAALILTSIVELYSFYLLKRNNYYIGVPGFVFVGLMHSILFSVKGIIHTHSLYHVLTIVLVTILGVYDKEKLNNIKLAGIVFAILAIICLEHH